MNSIGPLKTLPAPLARRPGDTALICQHVFDSIGIHANGDIVCWDADVHGKRVYGNVFEDRIADVYNGPAYREIREWFLKSRPDTWCPAVNHHCALRAIPATGDKRTDGFRVKVLRLEPVTYCNLHCPVCPVETSFKSDPHVRETRAQKLLPLQTMLDVVAQLPDLERIEYFGYGEPFIHKDTVTLLREVRRTRPGVQIVTNTSGTVMTPAQIHAIATEALMDRVVFSIDGATAESYRKYRIGGTFSKAFGKMKALTEASNAAGTRRRYAFDSPGGVQITWQYILFEWNDSDEELALARDLARNIGVPIEWVITSGYGASKRFLHGSADAMRLMDPPNSFIHMAANADIDNRLKEKGIESIYTREKGINIAARCELLSLPYDETTSYKAHIEADVSQLIRVPSGASVVFNMSVENRTGRAWDNDRPNPLRLGCLLKTNTGETVRELQAVLLPASAVGLDGQANISLQANVPQEPGEYKLMIDVVQEWICWFSDRGSRPLECTIRVVSESEKLTAFQRAIQLIKHHPLMIPLWLGRRSSANPRTSTQP